MIPLPTVRTTPGVETAGEIGLGSGISLWVERELSDLRGRAVQGSEIRLNVADVIVSLTIESGVRISGHVDSFVADEPAEATVSMQFYPARLDEREWHKLASDRRFGWTVFGTADGRSKLIERPGGGVLVRFTSEPGCDAVDVLLRTPGDGTSRGRWSERELLLVEILPLPVVVLLSERKGLFLHSCAVALEGEGILFSGVSGSGKSTMAELWRDCGPPTSSVIDDEHVLARIGAASTVLYGAPWSRGPLAATFSRTPLKSIFFIVHGSRNRCERLSSSEAFAELLSQVFLPFWGREHLELTVQSCADLLRRVDCYRLHFVPDAGIVTFVHDVLRNSR